MTIVPSTNGKLLIAAIVLATVVTLSPAQTTAPAAPDVLRLPNDSFGIPTDPDVSRNSGLPALVLNSTLQPMQDLPAWRTADFARFQGKRIRFSAYVKTSGKFTNFAGLCLHTFNDKQTCTFDDMIGRALTAASDWTKLEIVSNVAAPATGLAVGAHIKGSGQLWMDGAQIEVVDNNTPVTTDDSNNHMYTALASDYILTLDANVVRNGHPTTRITSSTKPTNSWAFLGPNDHFPTTCLGHRIRISAWVKSQNVTKGARVSCWAISADGKLLCIDEPRERASIKGTTDWTKYQITATVPSALIHLSPGVNLFGNGKLWIDDLRYELIPDDDSGL
jgi:hypothetical protein